MRSVKTNNGFALITALLIVALATIVSVNIASHLQLDIRRTGNMLSNEQAVQYVLAAENLLSIALYEDRQDNQIDYYGDLYDNGGREGWADIYEFPFDNAWIKSQAVDLQACLNLNSLIINGNVDATTQDRLRRLLDNVGRDEKLNLRGDLTQAIIDWIDEDGGQPQTTTPDGAEDTHYMNLEKPYRTANTYLESISELRLIKGFESSKTYDAVEPFLCAFGTPASINVNTAPEEVLNSIAVDVNGADIIGCREASPFEDIDGLLDCEDMRTTITNTQGLSVSTDYFLLKTEIKLGNSRTLMYSIINRDNNGTTRILARSQGAY